MTEKPPLTFETQSLDAFEVGEEFHQWLQVSGGAPPYSFEVTAGTLPSGINITGLGTVDGVPLAAGEFNFTVTAKDSAGYTAEQAFAVEVAPQPDPNGPSNWPLAWNNETSTFSMAVGVSFEINLQAIATGGTPPYKFDVTGGSLPNGLDMTAEGELAGAPTEAGDTPVVITLSDSADANVSQSFTCMVQEE